MRRNFYYFTLFILFMLLVGILAVLYDKSRGVDRSAYDRVNSNLRSLKQLDTEWHIDVLRSKIGVNQNYDPLASPQQIIVVLKNDLSKLASQIDISGNILPKVNEYQEAIQTKLELVEDFKSQHAILKNSLGFLPTAIEQLQTTISAQLLPGNEVQLGVDLEAELSRAARNNPGKQALQKLGVKLQRLLAEVLKYNLAPDPERKQLVEQSLSWLEANADQYEAEVAEQVRGVIAHSRTILKQKAIEDQVLKELEALPTVKLNDQLNSMSNQQFGLKLEQQNQYRQYLILYAGFLLLLLLYAAYRLLKAFAELRRANEHLEQRVDERTKDLNQALSHLQESQAQLVQSEKMASLGQMVAGITHEINTPLAYVKSGLEIINMRMEEMTELVRANITLNKTLQNEDASEETIALQLQQVGELSSMLEETDTVEETEGLLNDSLHGMEQIAEIVSNLKNFSRMDRAKIARFNVNEGLDSTLKIAQNVVKHKRVVKRYGDVGSITCSPSSINQVFLNLISNAAQAIKENGQIVLTTSQHEDHVQIEVEDDGCGMSQEVAAKIFDPFYTTKEIGKGTGLGLSIVQRIINEHGGKISVQSSAGHGTCFTVVLPNKALSEVQ